MVAKAYAQVEPSGEFALERRARRPSSALRPWSSPPATSAPRSTRPDPTSSSPTTRQPQPGARRGRRDFGQRDVAVGGQLAERRFRRPKEHGGPDGVVGTADDETELMIGATNVSVAAVTGGGQSLSISGASLALLVEPDDTHASSRGNGDIDRHLRRHVDRQHRLRGGIRHACRQPPADDRRDDADAQRPAGTDSTHPFSEIAGQGITVAMLGQQLSGDVTVTSSAGGEQLRR